MSQVVITLAIFIITLALFIKQPVPAGLTAIMGSLLMMAFGVISPEQVVSPFGSDTVIMVASVLILGNAVFETGAATSIGRKAVRFLGGSSERLFVAILTVVVAVLSAFLSNSAVVAIFIPLLASVARSSGGRITKKGTYMAVGIASIVGGNCTLAGSTPQLISQAILQSNDAVRELSFWELGTVGFPLVVVLALYYFFIGTKLQNKVFTFPEVEDPAADDTDKNSASKTKQIIVVSIMAACVIGFTTGVFSFGTVAAIAAALCILTGCISFEKAFKTLDWNTICVLGGAMGISTAINASGLMDLTAEMTLNAFGGVSANPRLMCTVLLIFSAVFGNVMSHTAASAVLTPLAISLGVSMGIDPIPFVVAVIIGCNLAFITPVATPPLTMTLVGGYRFTDYTKLGIIYNVLAIILSAVLIPFIYNI